MAFVASECAKCGAPIEINEDSKYSTCEYCGTKFLSADEIAHKKNNNSESAATTTSPVVNTVTQIINNTIGNTNKTVPVERPKINGCILVALIICFWPAAIVYGVVKSSAQKEWDNKNKNKK